MAACDENGSTLEIAACMLEQVIMLDAQVDGLQQASFDAATTDEERQAQNEENLSWLEESQARVESLTAG